MACCVLIAYVFSRILRVFRRDAESRTDPDVLRSVTAARTVERKGADSVH
jgi:hypothetical protein